MVLPLQINTFRNVKVDRSDDNSRISVQYMDFDLETTSTEMITTTTRDNHETETVACEDFSQVVDLAHHPCGLPSYGAKSDFVHR